MAESGQKTYAPLQLYGQEYVPETWAMANMNMIIHDIQGQIEIGDSFKNPKFRQGNRLRTFDRGITNPMWNQDWFTDKDYDADELDRFPKGAGFPGRKADWGWVQVVLAGLNETGRAAIVVDTGAAARGSGNANTNKEKEVRRYEMPQEVVREAIVNAVAHRDYTSNGSVQVMLFADRLEVWNPGTLPPSLTLEKLQAPPWFCSGQSPISRTTLFNEIYRAHGHRHGRYDQALPQRRSPRA